MNIMKFCWEMVVINRCLASLFDNIEDVFLKFYQGKICFLDPLCSARRWYEFPFFSDWNETTLSDLHITRLRMAQSKKGVYFVMLMRQKFSKFGAQKVFYGDSAVHDWPHRPTKPKINSWSWQFNEILIPVMLRRACSKVIRYWELARFLVLIFYSYVGSDFYVSTSNIRLLTWCIENNNLG